MKPVSLFGDGIEAISKFATAQHRINCYWDFRADNDKANAALLGTWGLVLWLSLPTFPVRAWHVVGNFLYVLAGSILYKVNTAGVATALGSVSISGTIVSMADNGLQLMVVDGVSLYCYTLVTGSYSQSSLNAAGSFGVVSDANFPNGTTSITFIDGRFIAEKPGTTSAYVSGFYDGTLWTPAAYFSKDNYSDTLLAVAAYNGLIILWGAASIEFWQDVGSGTPPYARIQGSTQNYGLAASGSRVIVNNEMTFLGLNPNGTVQVMQFDGYTPSVISSADVDAAIATFATYADAVALSYTMFGHVMYQLTFPSANRTFLYDSKTRLWQEVQTGLNQTGRHQASLGVAFGRQVYASDYANGNVYYFSSTTFTDNGTPIKRQLVSKHINNGGNEMSVSEVVLDMELGNTLLQSGQGSNPQVSVEVSKDNGETFDSPRLASIGKVGQYRYPRARWQRFGRAYDFVFRFTMTDPVRFVVTRGMVSAE